MQHVRHNLSHIQKEIEGKRLEKSVKPPSPIAIRNRNLKFSSDVSAHTFLGRFNGLKCVYDSNELSMLKAVNELVRGAAGL